MKAAISIFAPGFGLTRHLGRGQTFAALVFGLVALILADHSRASSNVTAIPLMNRALAIVLHFVAPLGAVTLFWPAAHDLIGFTAPDPAHPAVSALAVPAVLMAPEKVMPVWRWAMRHRRTVDLPFLVEKPTAH